jgi:hypothetical protein
MVFVPTDVNRMLQLPVADVPVPVLRRKSQLVFAPVMYTLPVGLTVPPLTLTLTLTLPFTNDGLGK